MEKERNDLVPTKTGPQVEKPDAVREAEKALQRWGLGLAGTGAIGSVAYWLALIQFDLYFPLQWWLIFLVALVALFFFPPNRGPRNARERTLSDVLDHIFGREGELLTSLESLHRAVVKRDATAAEETTREARTLLNQLRQGRVATVLFVVNCQVITVLADSGKLHDGEARSSGLG